MEMIINFLINGSGSFMGNAIAHLGRIKESLNEDPMVIFEKLIAFANVLQSKDLLDSIILPRIIDEYWKFFSADTPDNQIISPDDYNFSPTFIHCPYWIAIICSKLNLHPPPFAVRL